MSTSRSKKSVRVVGLSTIYQRLPAIEEDPIRVSETPNRGDREPEKTPAKTPSEPPAESSGRTGKTPHGATERLHSQEAKIDKLEC